MACTVGGMGSLRDGTRREPRGRHTTKTHGFWFWSRLSPAALPKVPWLCKLLSLSTASVHHPSLETGISYFTLRLERQK